MAVPPAPTAPQGCESKIVTILRREAKRQGIIGKTLRRILRCSGIGEYLSHRIITTRRDKIIRAVDAFDLGKVADLHRTGALAQFFYQGIAGRLYL